MAEGLVPMIGELFDVVVTWGEEALVHQDLEAKESEGQQGQRQSRAS